MPLGKTGMGKTLIVWGASSSVGSCGVQLAVAAGYEVFGVAGKKNRDFVAGLGAARVFDHGDPKIADEVVGALEGKTCVGAYDAISTEPTLSILCEILSRAAAAAAAADDAGGKERVRKLICGVMPGAETMGKLGVTVKTNFTAVLNKDTPVGPHIWREFMEKALVDGTVRFKPDPEVVGRGLEDVQMAIDLLAKGVSAKKIVVEL